MSTEGHASFQDHRMRCDLHLYPMANWSMLVDATSARTDSSERDCFGDAASLCTLERSVES